MNFHQHRADCERIEAERRLASELFHADADRLVAQAEIAAQRNTLAMAAGKQKSRRFVVEQHSAFGAFAS